MLETWISTRHFIFELKMAIKLLLINCEIVVVILLIGSNWYSMFPCRLFMIFRMRPLVLEPMAMVAFPMRLWSQRRDSRPARWACWMLVHQLQGTYPVWLVQTFNSILLSLYYGNEGSCKTIAPLIITKWMPKKKIAFMTYLSNRYLSDQVIFSQQDRCIKKV